MIYSRYSFFNYFDSLSIGCLCSFLLFRFSEIVKTWGSTKPWMKLSFAVFLVALPHILRKQLILGFVTVPLGDSLQNLGLCMLMMQSLVLPKYGLYRILNQPAVCALGTLSYSIYIWQQLFCTDPATLGLGQQWWMAFPLWLVTAIVIAAISYYGLERPFLQLRTRLRNCLPTH
jgi:peptidoglycan/LPS O-acetylase OafA/YrhL